MKVVYLTNQICGAGGLERVLSIKANYLTEALNYEIHIITLNQKNANVFYHFSDRIKLHDLEVEGNSINYILNYIKKLNVCISKIQPDLISVCDDGLKGFFVPKVLRYKCPMIYERHASKMIFKNKKDPSFFDKIKISAVEKLMDFGAKSYDAFVVLTQYNLSEWCLKNIKVIPNPLSFYPEKQSSLKNLKVITVGNHGYQKGYDLLLQIWKKVIDQHPNWTLDIYGKVDSKKKHYRLAEQLNICEYVNFYAPVKNIEEKYQEASIYAMTSRSEGFGMVLIEAMALGLPCIAFDCPCGPRDIIENLHNGFLIREGDIEGYAKRLIELIEDEELRIRCGSNARKTANNYEVEKIVAQWDLLFKNLTK
ncbi:glycosyltransferase family 4 protein [Aquimarina intermedia]|uniref:Glycosyltransferase involved in cell wall biosynthesis n=1 Tax=Aquimarina intermedia TaxID=350814 RepID=A0A5S5C9V0_9FLAO|nr:glycosyltransferase family 4 protein [Aquimarina intermedia]TYP75146.1 glycosyltransferase involved in cell wall biosynthesis [Aquimarina intermedia]